jgi:hypothetical protein
MRIEKIGVSKLMMSKEYAAESKFCGIDKAAMRLSEKTAV